MKYAGARSAVRHRCDVLLLQVQLPGLVPLVTRDFGFTRTQLEQCFPRAIELGSVDVGNIEEIRRTVVYPYLILRVECVGIEVVRGERRDIERYRPGVRPAGVAVNRIEGRRKSMVWMYLNVTPSLARYT